MFVFVVVLEHGRRLQAVVDLILETLRLCVEELDVIHQPLLDTVLIQLLPVTKIENPTSYRLATVGQG